MCKCYLFAFCRGNCDKYMVLGNAVQMVFRKHTVDITNDNKIYKVI